MKTLLLMLWMATAAFAGYDDKCECDACREKRGEKVE
jgi:hypothetical protein